MEHGLEFIHSIKYLKAWFIHVARSRRWLYPVQGSEVPVPPPRVSGFQVPGSDGAP